MLHSCGTLMKKVYYIVYKILFILRAVYRPADSTLLIRLRSSPGLDVKSEKWGWQDEIFNTNSSRVPFHVLTVTRISIPVMSACTVTGAGCHCSGQIVSCPNFAVQTSLQFSPQLGQQFPDLCLSLTVLTQSQNNPENPLISQDTRWHKQTY